MSKIRLIGAELSKINMYPGDRLYIRCTFQALEDMPVDYEVKLFADFKFGHMFIDKKEQTYFRSASDMYPQPAYWRKGEIWSSSVIWNIPNGLWAGSYAVSIGMIDNDTVPVEFAVGNKVCNICRIGNVNVVFDGLAKEYMKKHSGGEHFSYEFENIPFKEYDHSFDAVISVRNRNNDEEIKRFCVLKPNEKYSDDYVSFIIKKNKESYYVDYIEEKDEYELLYIKLPMLFTLENSKMITMYGEGRIVNPENSYPWGYEQSYWIRNAAILTNGVCSILIETPFLDDKILHSVCELNYKRFCAIGAVFSYRIKAYEKLESLKVINTPTVNFTEIGGIWQNCLPILREGTEKKTDMYDRSLFYYGNVCSGPGEPAETFDYMLDKIKKIHRLTGGVKQYMLLCGWQHEGHDTGYPDVFKLNEKCGTFDDLNRCVEEAKKYNACMTFHDNYDDMYEENGYFDKEIAATGPDGIYFTSWIWTSGISVMTSYPKYFKTGKLQNRVKKTVDMLPIDKSYHIDVLSQEVRRYDFAADKKAAAQEVLNYKLAVIDEFKKYGVTVTSEALTHPFAGKIGYAWRLNINKNKLFTDEEFIPLTAMIYHGLVPYSERGTDAILFGGNMVPPVVIDDEEKFQREFFLKTLPIGLLCNELMEDYCYKDGIHTMTYSNDSSIVYDEANDKIEVKHNGRYLTKDGLTLAKGYKDNEYFGYCERGDYAVNNIFKGQIEGIFDLSGNAVEYTADDNITIKVKNGIPFKIVLKID